MATTPKKGSKNTKAKPRRAMVKTSVDEQAQTIAELHQELEARNRDLAESLQRRARLPVRTCVWSKNSRNPWNSKPPQAKSLASLPARRPTYSRSLKRSSPTPRVCAMQIRAGYTDSMANSLTGSQDLAIHLSGDHPTRWVIGSR